MNLPAFENKKYTAYDCCHGNGPYGEISNEKEPIRTLGFALPYNNDVLNNRFITNYFMLVAFNSLVKFSKSVFRMGNLACVASVSVGFGSKERDFWYFARAENGERAKNNIWG